MENRQFPSMDQGMFRQIKEAMCHVKAKMINMTKGVQHTLATHMAKGST